MRKWIALGLAACMTVSSLTGCGSSQKETEAESTAVESVAEETTVEETTAEESEAAKTDLNKLVFTYVTSPLNVPTIIEKNQHRKDKAKRMAERGDSVARWVLEDRDWVNECQDRLLTAIQRRCERAYSV